MKNTPPRSDTCYIKQPNLTLFVYAGIECPRGSRNMPGGMQVAEPYSEEAMLFTKELVLQREVRPPVIYSLFLSL